MPSPTRLRGVIAKETEHFRNRGWPSRIKRGAELKNRDRAGWRCLFGCQRHVPAPPVRPHDARACSRILVAFVSMQRTDFAWQIPGYLKLVPKSFADSQSRRFPYLCELCSRRRLENRRAQRDALRRPNSRLRATRLARLSIVPLRVLQCLVQEPWAG